MRPALWIIRILDLESLQEEVIGLLARSWSQVVQRGVRILARNGRNSRRRSVISRQWRSFNASLGQRPRNTDVYENRALKVRFIGSCGARGLFRAILGVDAGPKRYEARFQRCICFVYTGPGAIAPGCYERAPLALD